MLVQQAIAKAQAGDPEGVHFLRVRYQDDVSRYVSGFVRDHAEAEDITLSIFAQLMKAIDKYEEDEVPFDAWLLRVARVVALDHLRAKRAIPVEEIRIADTGGAQTASDRGQTLRKALEDLPEDQREVLVLRHIAGLSPVEIASTLEKSESSVHALNHRGRRSLVKRLQDLQENQRALEELLQE